MTWAKGQRAGSVAAKAVLLILADHADDVGRCFPRQAVIATMTELSERSVRDQLRTLEASGLIRREHRQRTDGSRMSDDIFLALTGPFGAPNRNEMPDGFEASNDEAKRHDVPEGQPATDAISNRQLVPVQPEGRSGLTTFEPTDNKIEPPEAPQTGGDPPDEVLEAFDLWNAMAEATGLPKAKGLPEARRRKLRQRLRDSGLDGWREAMAAIRRSAFLRGQRTGRDSRPFKADLDFALQAKSFQRLLEGFYGEDAADDVVDLPARSPIDEWRRRLRGWVATVWWDDMEWGPKPSKPGCRAPPEILAEFDLTPATADVITFPPQGAAA